MTPSNFRLTGGSLPAPVRPQCDLLIIAGEHSGDEHAARLLTHALRKQPSLSVCALGGKKIESAGAQLLFDLTASSVVGVAEVLKHYGFFKQLFEQTVYWIEHYKPRTICFVDYPGFNLRLAERLVKDGIARKGGGHTRLLYYISPQVWAWKKQRRFKMARLLDALAVIFPFELGVFADTRLPTTYVGHPFAQSDYILPLCYEKNAPTLLLPGSRTQAVRRIFPIMLQAWERYLQTNPKASATVLYPNASIQTVIESCLSRYPVSLRESIRFSTTDHTAPIAAGNALTSSGTMSLNVALAGIPGSIVYRAHPLTYLLGRMLIDIPYLGIANLLLNQPAWEEFIQGSARPDILAEQIHRHRTENKHAKNARRHAKTLFSMLSAEAQESPEDWLLSRMNVA